jgi:hypothetical protein
MSKMLVRESDGYYNATLMCQQANKLYADYQRGKSALRYQDHLSNSIGIPRELLVKKTKLKKSGTWVHPALAADLHRWCSNKEERQSAGYVYTATSPLLNAVKIGCWTGSVSNLRKRYITPYGPELELQVAHVADCIGTEAKLHAEFDSYRKCGELFDKMHAQVYATALDKLV